MSDSLPPAIPPRNPLRGLENLLHQEAAQSRMRQSTRYKEGVQVGKFKLVRRLGSGGFGEVWLAMQKEGVSRAVALKLIKPGSDTERVLQRFQRERQSLGSMAHPNIARLLEAGEAPGGVPYFAMEHVENGRPITKFCDEEGISLRGRLRLFAQLCSAVQHAHDKGVIHRDLKPSNVLVALDPHDQPLVKVIDFGIAKLISGDVLFDTRTLEHGQLPGTPGYMAPEQLDGKGNTDRKADIYALGALLCELITGRAPLVAEAARDASQILEAMKHLPDPSAVLARTDEVERKRMHKRFAGLGTFEPRPFGSSDALVKDLIRQCRTDLDWVVIKARSTAPAARYSEASDLAQDIQRHLKGEPVEARRSTVFYVAGKFLEKNKRHVWRAAALIALLAFGAHMMNTTEDARRAEAQARKAEIEAHQHAEQETQKRRDAEALIAKMEKQQRSAAAAPAKPKPTPEPAPTAENKVVLATETANQRIQKPGLEEENAALLKKGNFTLLPEMKTKYPKLVYLTLKTESMDDAERQYWFDILPSMNADQIDRLTEILVTEAQKLEALEIKYQGDIEKLNQQHKERGSLIASARKEVEEKPNDVTAKLDLAQHLITSAPEKDEVADREEAITILKPLAVTSKGNDANRAKLLLLLAALEDGKLDATRDALDAFLAEPKTDAELPVLETLFAHVTSYAEDLWKAKKPTESLQAMAKFTDRVRAHFTDGDVPTLAERRLLGNARQYQGEWFSRMEQRKSAVEAYREAASLWQHSFAVQPKDPESFQSLSTSLGNLSSTFSKLGEYHEARLTAEESLRVTIVARDAEHPLCSGDKESEALSSAYGNLAWKCLFDRDFKAAIRACEAATRLESKTWIQGNLAHAMLFDGQTAAALHIYGEHRGEQMEIRKDWTWEDATREDFALFRAAGLECPGMREVEKLLGLEAKPPQ